MLVFITIIFGLILGSFLSVLLARLPENKQGIIAGRSECPGCSHTLAWYDLVPVASYIILLGRCRYCRIRISAWYPLLEITTAAILGLFVYEYGLPSALSVLDLLILFGLIALFFFDLKYLILPDSINISLIALVLVRTILGRPDFLVNAIVTGVLLTSTLGSTYIFSKGRWLGLGDVKMAMLIGLLFGFPGAVGVTLMAVWAGALVGLGLMIARKANMRTAMPFGSFWALAAIITILIPTPAFYISNLFASTF